ncbi:MAG: hypothetical protein MJZ07_05900 [Bacteroidales bacterium]|nr:hypothetical protein [Bacteroidales bacterium]
MAYKVILPLDKNWEIETEVIETEDGDKVTSFYANGLDPKKTPGSIEIYVGDLNGSDPKTECLNNYDAALGLEEGEEPVQELPFCGQTAWYYDCEDDQQNPVIVICVEIKPQVLAIVILAEKDEERLDDLMSYVDENFTVE